MRPSEDETQKVTIDRDARASLTALWEGGGLTISLPDEGELVLGRGGSADIVVDHPSISRRHAVLHLGAELEIEDLGSSNGTKVRGCTLRASERVRLAWGEPVELGKTVVMVQPPSRRASGESEIGASDGVVSMAETRRLIDLVAPTHISVLLLGETGVGKGHIAHQIHAQSKRASGPWLHLNCAALPEHLLESELFGHERGAFTGAGQAKPGLLESASGGTVFLDEVADLPPSVQAKLLIALERGEVMRIGALKPQRFDVRFISATNRLLDPQERNAFRPDLYYRLAGLPIIVPPLRERRSEIPALAQKILEDSCARLGRAQPEISSSVNDALASYDWPGNIRELASSLERALLLCGPQMFPHHLGLGRRSGSVTAPKGETALERKRTSDVPTPVPPTDPPPAARQTHAEEVGLIERRRIVEALEQCGGNQVRAADLLGISRRTLISRMVSFGLRRPRKG